MNTELQIIADKWTEKTTSKYKGLDAMQAALLDEKNEVDSSVNWATWQEHGIQGNEGKFEREFQSLVDSYVKNHPAEFKQFVEPVELTLEQCVETLEILRLGVERDLPLPGMLEDFWRTEIWIRYHFTPQNIGGAVVTSIRMALGS